MNYSEITFSGDEDRWRRKRLGKNTSNKQQNTFSVLNGCRQQKHEQTRNPFTTFRMIYVILEHWTWWNETPRAVVHTHNSSNGTHKTFFWVNFIDRTHWTLKCVLVNNHNNNKRWDRECGLLNRCTKQLTPQKKQTNKISSKQQLYRSKSGSMRNTKKIVVCPSKK